MSGIKSQPYWIFIRIGCAIVHCTHVQQGSIFVQDRQWMFDLGFTMGKQLIALLAKMHFKSDLVLIKLIELHAWNVSHKNVECHRTAAKNIWPLTAVGHHCTYIYLTLFFKIEYCIIVDNCPELEITRPEIEWLLSPSGDLGIRLVWHNLSPPHPTPPHRTAFWSD